MAHKAIPDQGHPHLSLGRQRYCKGRGHTATAGAGTGDGGIPPVSAIPCSLLQATTSWKAQFILLNLTRTLCSLAQSSQHRAARMYFKLFYPSEVAGSTQIAFWGWCQAYTNHLAVLCMVGADPHARDRPNHSPAQITSSVPWHYLAIGKENFDSICLILVQNWVFSSLTYGASELRFGLIPPIT